MASVPRSVLGHANGVATSRGAGERVAVVVDASPTVRAVLARHLKRAAPGMVIHEADSADAAVALTAAERPDLVFIECAVPAADGAPAALALLKADPGLKVVALTADGRSCDNVRAVVREGAFAVLEKPLRHAAVRLVLEEADQEDGAVDRLR